LPLFPGATALLLTGVALVNGVGWRHAGARMWLALGLVGLVLSFGASLPGYDMLYHAVPLLQGIRASVRFGYLALAGVAALSAFGLAVILQRYPTRPGIRTAIAASALVLVTGEALRIPVGYSPPHVVPGAYALLRDIPDAVLLEWPLPDAPEFQFNANYMLNSTTHWRPIVNGYSGFLPRSYHVHSENLRPFPDPSSLAYLRRIGVTHVAVHPGLLRHPDGQAQLEAIRTTPALRAAIQGQDVVIYELLPEGR
jgi:hypothetical protein